MLLNQHPFMSHPIDDGYRPSQSAKAVTVALAAPLRYAAGNLPDKISHTIGWAMEYKGPMESVQQRVVAPRVQIPGLLPSGTK